MQLEMDSNYTLSQVTYPLNHRTSAQISCPPSQVESTKHANLSFHGFRNTGNRRWWTALLDDFVHNFNFTDILIRRINAVAPPPHGPASKAWAQCARALTNLLQQTEIQSENGRYETDPLYFLQTMVSKCLPAFLLRVPCHLSKAVSSDIIVKIALNSWKGRGEV